MCEFCGALNLNHITIRNFRKWRRLNYAKFLAYLFINIRQRYSQCFYIFSARNSCDRVKVQFSQRTTFERAANRADSWQATEMRVDVWLVTPRRVIGALTDVWHREKA